MDVVLNSVNTEYDRLFPFKLQSFCGYQTAGRSQHALNGTPLLPGYGTSL
jgi:hypothetical protein